jgi:hypothetical protein
MAFRVVKHGNDEKVEVYYEWILKLANCLQHKVDDSLLGVGLIPYLRIAIEWMKRNTLFKHKEFAITYEEPMENVAEYQKLLEPSKKLEKTSDNTWIKKMCDFCHKPGHLKECYCWNLENQITNWRTKKII